MDSVRSGPFGQSTCTTTKLLVASMYPGQFLWTWSQAPWTVSGRDPSDKSSDLTTSYLDRVGLAITGQRDITQKALNWLIPFWMLFEKKLSLAIVCKDSS